MWNEILRFAQNDTVSYPSVILSGVCGAKNLIAPERIVSTYLRDITLVPDECQIDYLTGLEPDCFRLIAGPENRVGGIATLAERMSNEAIANGSVTVGRTEIGAWSRV